jgi:hypothetical protein
LMIGFRLYPFRSERQLHQHKAVLELKEYV